MGLVYTEIELINGEDLSMARHKLMDPTEVKRAKITTKGDPSFYMLCINEAVQEKLQFPVVERRKVRNADGNIAEFDVVDNVEVRFKNRSTTCRAMILPGESEAILGAIPINGMDVLIHSQRQELIVNPVHPYFAQMKLK